MINETRLRKTFLDLLRINSPSGHERAIMDYLRPALETLGFAVTEDGAGRAIGGNAGNLIARWPGTVEAPTLFFNAHVDTVRPTDRLKLRLEDGVVRTDGKTILGGDDKTGVVVLLETFRLLAEQNLPHGPIELVYTVSEENGLRGAKALDLSPFQASLGFVLDGGLPMGTITLAAPTQHNLRVQVKGRKAHAGVHPEDGVNAIAAASAAIAAMRQGRIDAETTANVGVIRGGEATNIVPDLVEVHCEARSHAPHKLAAQIKHMKDCFRTAAYRYGAEVQVEVTERYRAFRVPEDAPVAQLAARASERAGFKPLFQVSGGGSDANIFNERGLPCVILACGEQGPHTTEECVALSDLADAVRWMLAIVEVGLA